MKKFSILMAALMIGNIVVVPQALAGYHYSTTQQPQFKSEEERALYQKYYDEKDLAKKAVIAKEFVEKFPNSDFAKFAKGTIEKQKQTEASTNFRSSLDAFYAGPDEAKLNKLLTDSETFLTVFPNNEFAITQMALATGGGALGGYYKDVAKSQALAEKALKVLEATAAPKDWKQEDWDKFRREGISRLTLYQGLYQLRQPTPNVEQAITYFNKVTENKDWPQAKDPATYLLRAEANNITYDKMSEEYRALDDEKKRGEEGKAVLAKIDRSLMHSLTTTRGRWLSSTRIRH
jgi:hypothetical protein